ncbi:MAG: hypothetical protein JKX94_04740 [Sneathiella sp.]|nr:hypothetical protein [Sneathiella sp.]
MNKHYPSVEEHTRNWEKLAAGIAATKDQIKEYEVGEIPPNSQTGSLTILGTGIETIGVAIGDKRLIEEADKVLYCVADPATVTWLNQIRSDALDLYVLYGEDKIRYVTYMQMTEAQLYWVRKGLKVVVLFYGHPGIFVLSTHRAMIIAKREGYRASMKAGVCALDTLCADLGVDPCNPGLQTYEATEALIRQRVIDTSANVVLWQVGLIGESGYRRLGFLNNNFSYFINWLQGIYGEDFEVIHYIGSRYPSIDPVIEPYKLSDLHRPDIQSRINGLSTFYIPPKDTVETSRKICSDLGMIKPGQSIVPQKTPLREIGKYSSREMKAFDAFAKFKVPFSYKFQAETEPAKFLIELRFDPQLQELYRDDPVAALNDSRFKGLSDTERNLLATRESGAAQVAAKGLHIKHAETDRFLNDLLTKRSFSLDLAKIISGLPKHEAQSKVSDFIAEQGYDIDWREVRKSFDALNRLHLYPWTGTYIEKNKHLTITLIGSLSSPRASLLYINDTRIRKFGYKHGILQWQSSAGNPYNGYLKPDITLKGVRNLVGKIWNENETVPKDSNFVAFEVNPNRAKFLKKANTYFQSNSIKEVEGEYVLRTTGKYAKTVNKLLIRENNVLLNDTPIPEFEFDNGQLSWSGGTRECYSGKVSFLFDPILGSSELFGTSRTEESDTVVKCYGASTRKVSADYAGPEMPEWASAHLLSIVSENTAKGGLMYWHKWEKHSFATRIANKFVTKFT